MALLPRLAESCPLWILALALATNVSSAQPAPWIADRGDGTYRNPILYADYSDPDVIRVGADYWLTSSSFCHVPALPILHSRDLVNWELVNHALPQLVPVDHFRTVRHGQGVWAPALRYHAGLFYLYYPDPDFGLYLVTAKDPRAEWSTPVLVKAGKGMIDPCPLWDDDGRVYLVHGWAQSRGPIANRLSVCELSPDGFRAVTESRDIIDGNKMPGWETLEGPKFYKRQGYYYVFAPAGGVKKGYQAVFRAKQIYGPYENRIVLGQGSTPINGPHQGAWVDTPTGENWFIHFQDQEVYGRVVHLQPMIWRDDGWPAMGTAVKTGAVKGEPVLTYPKPRVTDVAGADSILAPATSDSFDAPKLGLQWQWQANPQADWYSLSVRSGSLQLRAVPLPERGLYDAPNLLLQKFPAPEFTVTTVLDGSALGVGSEAGLIVFGYSYAWIGLRRDNDGLKLVQLVSHEHDITRPDGEARRGSESVRPIGATPICLRVSVGAGARCRFSYSTDGTTFTRLGDEFEATVARWVGGKVGLFTVSPREPKPGAGNPGHALFTEFKLEK